PALTVTTHADAGVATPGWYLVSNGVFAIAFDGNGVPVWYRRSKAPLDVDSQLPGTISFMPEATAPFGTLDGAHWEVDSLVDGSSTTYAAVGAPTDPHELRLLDNGDAIVVSYP